MSMQSIYSRFYWKVGFKSHLYDLLLPQAYTDSFKRLSTFINTSKEHVLLDAGCGSGTFLNHINLNSESTYIGVDLLMSGVSNARIKKKFNSLLSKTYFILSDISKSLPMRNQSVDIIVAHFSLYTIDIGKREFIFKEFRRLLKKGGTLILVEPSTEYSAKRIISDSIKLVTDNDGKFVSLVKKWFFYPFTYYFGLKFIESQLKKGTWRAIDSAELCDEVRANGYTVNAAEQVYADSATLIISS
jgi:ubiquinone/menaquinone biosynthesis C-methylase UbiE